MYKKKLYIIFAIIIVALLPSAVFASVVVEQSITTTTGTSVANPLYIAEGPNYSIANKLGFTVLTQNTTSTATSITFSYTSSMAILYLVNVLEIRGEAHDLNGNKVSLYTSSSSKSSPISLYLTSRPVVSSADPTILDNNISQNLVPQNTTTSISTLTPTGANSGTEVLGYVTVVLSGTSASSPLDDTVTFSYTIL